MSVEWRCCPEEPEKGPAFQIALLPVLRSPSLREDRPSQIDWELLSVFRLFSQGYFCIYKMDNRTLRSSHPWPAHMEFALLLLLAIWFWLFFTLESGGQNLWSAITFLMGCSWSIYPKPWDFPRLEMEHEVLWGFFHKISYINVIRFGSKSECFICLTSRNEF